MRIGSGYGQQLECGICHPARLTGIADVADGITLGSDIKGVSGVKDYFQACRHFVCMTREDSTSF